jgi:protein-tyrosine phosphatase
VASVLFVCLGNICRSPTAHGVFSHQVAEAGLSGKIVVDSAGTGAWHVGEPPDARAAAAALLRGYDLSPLRARQVTPSDFGRFDYILAMDRGNLSHLEALCPEGYTGQLGLFLDFHPASPIKEVPDPYYGGDEGFEEVLDLVERAGEGLLRALEPSL